MTRTSKTLPPSIPVWFIRRPALEERLAEAWTRRLTTVVAGPGFGKSTLLSAWAADNHVAWYTLGPEDEALPTFAAGLVGALMATVSDLSGIIADPIVMGLAGDQAAERARAEAFGTHLSEELEAHLAEDLAVVFDDVHAIQAGGAAARLIEELVRQAPVRLHVVLSSRVNPPFGIERLRGRGEVLSIEDQMLAFSREELSEFLAASLGEDASLLVGRLDQLTAGWPAAVRLAVEALRAAPRGERTSALARLSRPGGQLFAYLAEEVFAGEPESVRELFRRTALFDRFNAELCEALEIKGAAETIAALLDRGLFLQVHETEDHWFSLHALVREFTLGSWPLEPDESRDLLRSAAAWFESHGFIEEALRSLAEAADYPGVTRVLSERGESLVAAGGAESIVKLGEALPAGFRASSIEALMGYAHAIRGEGEEALECFRRAAGRQDALPPPLATRIGVFHHSRGEFREAARVFEAGRANVGDPVDEAILLAALAETRWQLGKYPLARSLARRALQLAEASGDQRARMAAYTALGMVTEDDKRAAVSYLRQALKLAEGVGDVLRIVRIRHLMAAAFAHFLGLHAEALECLDVVIPLAEMTGFVHEIGWCLYLRGESRFAIGMLGEAMADLKEARSVLAREGSADSAFPAFMMGDIYRELGNLAQARAAYEEAIAGAEDAHDAVLLCEALPGLARVLAGEDPEEAARLAERAASYGESSGTLVRALMAQGWIALSSGEHDLAARIGQRAIELARLRHQLPMWAEALELKAVSAPSSSLETAALEEAALIWREVGNPIEQAKCELALGRLSREPGARARAERAERRLRSFGVRSTPPLAAGLLSSLPSDEHIPVRVRTLGGFAVLRRDQVVPLTEWQSKKARDLLKILVARRGRPTPREFLMEVLWPEESPAKTAHRLSVSLATVRSVLDPARAFSSDAFVTGDKDTVSLDLSNLPVDVEDFLTEARAGLSIMMHSDSESGALDVLESAEAAYTGDFLEEDAYQDWAAPLREEARSLYISVVGGLARAAGDSGDHDTSARYLLRLLDHDPYDEGAHLALVTALIEAGRHGEARRRYRTYVSKMREIDVEAAPFPSSRV